MVTKKPGRYGADQDDDDDALPAKNNRQSRNNAPRKQNDKDTAPPSSSYDGDKKQAAATKPKGLMASKAPPHEKTKKQQQQGRTLELAPGSHSNINEGQPYNNNNNNNNNQGNHQQAKNGRVSTGRRDGKTRVSNPMGESLRPGSVAVSGNAAVAQRYTNRESTKSQGGNAHGGTLGYDNDDDDEQKRAAKKGSNRKSTSREDEKMAQDQMLKKSGVVDNSIDKSEFKENGTMGVNTNLVATTTATNTNAVRRSNREERRAQVGGNLEAMEADDDDSYSTEEDQDMIPGAVAIAGMRGGDSTRHVEDELIEEYDQPSTALTETTTIADGSVAVAKPVEDEEEEEESVDEEALRNAIIAEEIDEIDMKKGMKGWVLRHKLVVIIMGVMLCAAVIIPAVLLTGNSGSDSTPPTTTVISREEAALQQQSERFRNVYEILVGNYTSSNLLLFDTTSPQHAAIRWIADEDPALLDFEAVGPEKVAQRYGLATLYFSTSGDNWNSNVPFLTKSDECDWFEEPVSSSARAKGVTCGDDGFVTSLSFAGVNLNGTLPDEISIFTSLDFFDLSNNMLSSTIPTILTTLTDLRELRLSMNVFTGSIPIEIGNMTGLEQIILQSNGLNGRIPASIGSMRRLRGLDLSFNDFSGAIPSELGLLTDLRIFFVQHNRLSGSVPSTMSAMTGLRQVDISYNVLEEGADNICALDVPPFVYVSDCLSSLIPAIVQEICCPCCSLCCSESSNSCQGNNQANNAPCATK